MKAISTAWMGFHEEGLPTLEWLIKVGKPPVCAVTLTAEAAAKRSGCADIASICVSAGIPVLEVANANSDECLEFLRRYSPDLLLVLGWSQILKDPLLSLPAIGVVGAHASVLPHNRGSAPVNWALIRGEDESGNTLMWLNAGVDTGEIIAQRAFPLELWDTCATVYGKVATSNQEMVAELIAQLEKGIRPGRAQPETDEPLLPRRRPEDGRIDWSSSATEVYNFVRALTRPYPGAFTQLEGEPLTVWSAGLMPPGCLSEAPAGTVLGPVVSPVHAAVGVAVACGEGVIVLFEIEAGGRCVQGRDLPEALREGVVLG